MLSSMLLHLITLQPNSTYRYKLHHFYGFNLSVFPHGDVNLRTSVNGENVWLMVFSHENMHVNLKLFLIHKSVFFA